MNQELLGGHIHSERGFGQRLREVEVSTAQIVILVAAVKMQIARSSLSGNTALPS